MSPGAPPELRCRACQVMGGTVVGDKEGAIFTEALREVIRREVYDGERLEITPCIPAAQLRLYPKERGQACPRVPLRIENAEALELAGVLLDEAARHGFVAVLPAVLPDQDEFERAVIVRRAFWALRDPRVMAARYPKPKPGPGKR